jgi:hypothetical protein
MPSDKAVFLAHRDAISTLLYIDSKVLQEKHRQNQLYMLFAKYANA